MAHIHLVGIGGAGLSAIATVLLQQGHQISGSDQQESATTRRLSELGAKVLLGHRAENITTPDSVVISSAVPQNNVEVVTARQHGIPVYKRPAWLGKMMTDKRGLTIAGTHGKTTTTAMAALTLQQAQLDPSFIVGGFIPQLNTNASAGESDIFIIEADEYDHTFLSLNPEIAIITNLEWDHPDIYPTLESLERAFHQFAALIPPHGHLILCGDDPGARQLVAKFPQAITYGLHPDNLWQASDPTPTPQGYRFDIRRNGILQDPPGYIELQVPGLHNVQNALAVYIAARLFGVQGEVAAKALGAFQGTARRFQLKGQQNGITVIDDYAHHPTEITATLQAARTRYPKQKIWAVFQPHTYSRTKLLLPEFAAALSDEHASAVILLDIFSSAREQDDGSISSAAILAQMSHPQARHLGQMEAAVDFLTTHLRPGDVVITLGAGDGYLVGERVLSALKAANVSEPVSSNERTFSRETTL